MKKEITPKDAIVAMLAMKTIAAMLLPPSDEYVPMREFNRYVIPLGYAKKTLENIENGEGIPEDAKKKIMQNFFTAWLWFTTLMGDALQANRAAVDEFLKDK